MIIPDSPSIFFYFSVYNIVSAFFKAYFMQSFKISDMDVTDCRGKLKVDK